MSFTSRGQLAVYDGHVAWVETSRGVANVFGAVETPTGLSDPFALTNWTADDGMEISLFGFYAPASGDGVPLVHYDRRPSDDSNPTHACSPPIGGLYSVPFGYQGAATSNSTSTLITTKRIVDSAHGRLLYVANNEVEGAGGGNLGAAAYRAPSVMMLKLALTGDSVVGAPRRLFTTKHGIIGSMAWSPDGQTLAFSNDRGDHGYVGLYHYSEESSADGFLSWLSPSYDTDTWPHWSPDGTMLVFRRDRDMTGADGRDSRCVQHGYCGTAGPAYSLMLSKIENGHEVGTARVLFTDHRSGYPNGAAGYGIRGIIWHGVQLLFGCETSGFVHVHAVSNVSAADGDLSLVDLTPLPCDNQAYSLIDGELYVTSNCDSVDSLGIAKVDMSTKKRSVLVEGTNHTVSGMTHAGGHLAKLRNGKLLYVDTTAKESTTLRLFDPATAQTTAVTPPSPLPFNGSAFVSPELVTFASLDGLTVHGQLFKPASADHSSSSTSGGGNSSGSISPGPAVIFTHGGCQRQMYAAFHYGADYASLYAQNQYLASRGYTVLSINYRGGPGYGVSFRAANGSGWQGASEYQDVLAGAKWLGQQPGVDASRIGIYGLSYGGLNTLQALSRNSDVFACGVANAPVFNWLTWKRFDGVSQPMELALQSAAAFRTLNLGPRTDLATGNWLKLSQANTALALESSPAGHLEKLTSPLLVIHGDSDANVDFAETVGVVGGLRARGFAGLETLVFPDERHGLVRFANQVKAAAATMDFFDRHLQQ
eukprot:g1667.t1